MSEGSVGFRLLVVLLRSSAIANPAIVMTRAVIFMYRGIVIT